MGPDRVSRPMSSQRLLYEYRATSGDPPEIGPLSARRLWLKIGHQHCHASRVGGDATPQKPLLAIDEVHYAERPSRLSAGL
jgi:hypothetical protein